MPKVKVNFADIEDFEALPEGVYSAVIEKVEYREPKEKGKAPYLNVEYTVSEGEFESRKLWEVLSWSPKALFRMRDFFLAFGFEDGAYELDIDDESNLLLDPDLVGYAVELTVENEIYNKKEVNRVVAMEVLSEDKPEAPPVADEAEAEEVAEEEEEPEADEPKKTVAKKAAPPARKGTFRPTTTGVKKRILR